MDLELINAGKKTGLSFSEMNEMRVQDLLDFVDIDVRQYEDLNNEQSGVREANQSDIDKFLA